MRRLASCNGRASSRRGSFIGPTGRSIRGFRRARRTACRKAGCLGRILHDFRRTAVRNLDRAGVPAAWRWPWWDKTEAIYRR
jgi:hypothetical protein